MTWRSKIALTGCTLVSKSLFRWIPVFCSLAVHTGSLRLSRWQLNSNGNLSFKSYQVTSYLATLTVDILQCKCFLTGSWSVLNVSVRGTLKKSICFSSCLRVLPLAVKHTHTHSCQVTGCALKGQEQLISKWNKVLFLFFCSLFELQIQFCLARHCCLLPRVTQPQDGDFTARD